MNRIDARSSVRFDRGLSARNNQHVLVVWRIPFDVRDLFVHVALHPTAQWRVKLREIANFHGCFVIPSEVEESLTVVRRKIDNYSSSSLRYFSASIAAAQPE